MNKLNSKQFQITHSIQQKHLNQELFKLTFDNNIKKICTIIKHLNITINLSDGDIKGITEKTKSQFINFTISYLQSVKPVQQQNNTLNLNFDINKILPLIGNTMVRNQLLSDYGTSAIAQHLHTFFVSINNHHLLLMKRNQNLYFKDNIDPIFLPISVSHKYKSNKNKSNYFTNKKQNKHRKNNNSYYPQQNKYRNNYNFSNWGSHRNGRNTYNKNKKHAPRNGINAYHSNNYQKYPKIQNRYANRAGYNYRNKSQNLKKQSPSFVSTFAPSFNQNHHSYSEDNDEKMD